MKTKSLCPLGLVLLLLLVLAASCSTVPHSQNEARIERLLEELNNADIDRLISLSALPFLLDGELINREQDIEVLWTNLRKIGFSFANAQILSVKPAVPEDFTLFSDDPETAAFFEKYLSPDAAVVHISSDFGSFLLLTGSRLGRVPLIYGFTDTEQS